MLKKMTASLVLALSILQAQPAHADRHADAIAGMIFVVVVGGTAMATIVPDVREHYRQQKVKQEELARASSSMRTELGARYDEVVEAMANRESAESLAWLQDVGPTSKEAFQSYSKLLAAIQR